jgi:hypothetical protein
LLWPLTHQRRRYNAKVLTGFTCFGGSCCVSKAEQDRSTQAAKVILGILYMPLCFSVGPRGLPQGAFLPWIAGTAIDSNAIVLKLNLGRPHRFPESQPAISQVGRIIPKSLTDLRAIDVFANVAQGGLRVDLAELSLKGDISGSVLEGASDTAMFGLE